MEYATSLKEIEDLLKKNHPNKKKGKKIFDEASGLCITAGTIYAMWGAIQGTGTAAVLTAAALAPLATGASISAISPSTMLNWIQEKFVFNKKSSELKAIEHYEHLTLVHFFIVQVSAREGLKEIVHDLIAWQAKHKKSIKGLQEPLSKAYLDEDLDSFAERSIALPLHSHGSFGKQYFISIFNPLLLIFDRLLSRLSIEDQMGEGDSSELSTSPL